LDELPIELASLTDRYGSAPSRISRKLTNPSMYLDSWSR
jgi:hypothetical protein